MVNEKNTEWLDLFNWASQKPDLLEQLARMRELEECGETFNFDRMELEMLELCKAIGASSFARSVQAQESKAFEAAKAADGGRTHGKKN